MQILRIASKLRYIDIPRFGAAYTIPDLYYPIEGQYATWISQLFGVNPQNYKPMRGHDGIDWAIGTGNYILAPCRMRITDLILQTNSYGRHAWGQDDYGNRYIFGHLNSFRCRQGDQLEQGQVFALSGGGLDDPYHGYSTGPHLHFELRPAGESISNGYGGAIDPFPYFKGASVPLPAPEEKPIAYGIVDNDKGLTVRTGGSIFYKAITVMPNGTIFPIFDISSREVWLHINADRTRYSAAISSGKQYIKVLTVEEYNNLEKK